TPSQPQPNLEPEPEPEPEPDIASWTIQWIALASETATRAFAATLFAGLQVDYDIEQIQVGSRRFYILFSGRYPTKALAAQAATQMPLASGEEPYLRTLASIAAVRVD
ncbi:MAG: SPOR domain-containing protein, partial [Pseudomonadota bacterium]|nr:SPOR domain-containing protein [Pseudomonadota bacterium]